MATCSGQEEPEGEPGTPVDRDGLANPYASRQPVAEAPSSSSSSSTSATATGRPGARGRIRARRRASIERRGSPSQRQQQQQQQQHPPQPQCGYDAYFDPPLDKKLECPICLFALRDPIQTSCGHRFCRTCIERSLQTEAKNCPVDKRKLSKAEIYPDNWCRREVMCLQCKCRNIDEGCDWSGQLKDFEDHIDSTCEYVLVSCQNAGCTVEVKRCDLPAHLEGSCEFRTIACEYCGQGVAVRLLESHHAVECQRYPQDCPQECGEQVPRCEVADHIDKHCTNTPVHCRYVGCDWKGMRTSYFTHCQEYMQHHVEMNNQALIGQTGSVSEVLTNMNTMTQEIADMSRVIEDMRQTASSDSKAMDMARTLSEKLANISRVVDHTVLRVSDIESKLIQLERKSAVDRADYHTLSEKLDRTTTTLQNNMAKLLTVVELQNSSHASGGTMPQMPSAASIASASAASIATNVTSLVMTNPGMADPAVSYDGTMIWQLNGWTSLRAKAMEGKRPSVYSSPFYTAIRGYKVRVRLYPNGDGIGKNNCVSIFFTICKGEFDAILPWPFRSKVTFTLVDQMASGTDMAESFVPDSSSSSFHRPRGDMNIASGCPLFIPLARLQENGPFVQNDCITIKIVVEQKTV